LVRLVVVLLLLVVAAIAGGLIWTHMVVERARGPLPLVSDLLDIEKASDLPVKVSVIETAQQPMPRSAVLDPGRDPRPDAPYQMTHPSFVLEWSDGRLLLVDAGMTQPKAIEFGDLLQRFGGAGTITPLKSAAGTLGPAAARVQGIVFTHLHIDHTDGLRELCPRIGHPVKVFQTPAQQDVWTFTTSEGRRLVQESGCVSAVRLGTSPLIPLEGFPGVAVIAAAGHTPGSQLVVAAVQDASGTVKRYAFSGDVTNTIDGIRSDIPKPFLYRLVVVPEDDDRLGELRRYLRVLEREQGFVVVPSHDGGHLKSLGLPTWGS
jgi:glyoxylase-like metal-dependent hydrolase (beta-lactamase superfamily II)